MRGAEKFGILLLPVGVSRSANRPVKLTSRKPAASLWVCAPQFTFTLAKIHYAKSESVANNTSPVLRSIMNQGKEKEWIDKFNNQATNSKKYRGLALKIIVIENVEVFRGR